MTHSDEPAPPRICATLSASFAGKPGWKHTHLHPGRVEVVAGLLRDRRRAKLYRLAGLPSAGLCQDRLEQCRQPEFLDVLEGRLGGVPTVEAGNDD